MIELNEHHRDFLADMVDHSEVLGRTFGKTKKHIPSGVYLELLVALLNDYSQAAYAHWEWQVDTPEAAWRTKIIVESAIKAKKYACRKQGLDNVEAHSRFLNLSEALQHWYKRIDYLPDSSLYVVGQDGQEFPSPEDLLYLIAVVLEAMHDWAKSTQLLVFYGDKESEEYKLAGQWCELSTELKSQLLSSYREAMREDWGPKGLKKLFGRAT